MKQILSILFMAFLGLCTVEASQLPEHILQEWQFKPVEKGEASPLQQFTLNEDGTFVDQTNKGGGTYIIQGKSLHLNYANPYVYKRTFQINLIDSLNLVLEKNGAALPYISKNHPNFIRTQNKKGEQVAHQGFSIMGLMRGLLGLLVLIFISYLFSSNKRAIKWRKVFTALAIQFTLGVFILNGDKIGFNIGNTRFDLGFIGGIFDIGGKFFTKVLGYTAQGSQFLLSGLVDVESYGFIFLFQVLPILIFFSALTSVLFYLGIIQWVVRIFAKLLTKALDVSGAEALSVAGNIFLGQTESPLMIKEYLPKMNRSEILLVMIGGMATVAGSVLGAYIGFLGGSDPVAQQAFAKHLLAASVMAAPGAILVSKILIPQSEAVIKAADAKVENVGSNILDALSNGTTQGLKLAANVGAMLLVFIACIAMLNSLLSGIGEWTGLNAWIMKVTQGNYLELSLEFILGYVFAPLMWLIGVPDADLGLMGQLLGIKLVLSEFVAYINLSEIKSPESLRFLKYQKSVVMATYMLCGFANFASIGIQIGGIGMLAPSKKTLLSELGMKALLGGTIASLISATIAGILIG